MSRVIIVDSSEVLQITQAIETELAIITTVRGLVAAEGVGLPYDYVAAERICEIMKKFLESILPSQRTTLDDVLSLYLAVRSISGARSSAKDKFNDILRLAKLSPYKPLKFYVEEYLSHNAGQLNPIVWKASALFSIFISSQEKTKKVIAAVTKFQKTSCSALLATRKSVHRGILNSLKVSLWNQDDYVTTQYQTAREHLSRMVNVLYEEWYDHDRVDKQKIILMMAAFKVLLPNFRDNDVLKEVSDRILAVVGYDIDHLYRDIQEGKISPHNIIEEAFDIALECNYLLPQRALKQGEEKSIPLRPIRGSDDWQHHNRLALEENFRELCRKKDIKIFLPESLPTTSESPTLSSSGFL